MLGGSIKAARSALVAGVAFAVPVCVIACSASQLRYASVHVGGGGTSEAGTQLYAVGDDLRWLPAVAPAGYGRPSTTDTVFELRTCTTDAGSFAELWERHDTERTRVSALRIDGAPSADVVAAIKDQLRDAGHPIGFDVTFAFVDEDDTTRDAGGHFHDGLSRFHDRTAQTSIEDAVTRWKDILEDDDFRSPSGRFDHERAMAAAFNIAIAYELSGEHDEALVFESIAVLRAPTHALELDVQRLVRSTALVGERPPWKLWLPKRDQCAVMKKEKNEKPLTNDPSRHDLGRYVARWRDLRPALAADALTTAARRSTGTDDTDPIRASADVLFRAARVLRERNHCPVDGGAPAGAAAAPFEVVSAKANLPTIDVSDGGVCP